jgi:hypothetical protein
MQGVLKGEPEPPSQMNPKVPKKADEVVLKALEKRKEDRYEGVLTFRKELDRLFEEYTSGKITGTGSVGTATEGEKSEDSDKKATRTEDDVVTGTSKETKTDSKPQPEEQTQKAQPERSEGSPPQSPSQKKDDEGESSWMTRRRVLLGLGLLGGGGWLATTQMGGGDNIDDSSGSTVPTGSPTDSSGNDETTTDSPTDEAETDDGGTQTKENPTGGSDLSPFLEWQMRSMNGVVEDLSGNGFDGVVEGDPERTGESFILNENPGVYHELWAEDEAFNREPTGWTFSTRLARLGDYRNGDTCTDTPNKNAGGLIFAISGGGCNRGLTSVLMDNGSVRLTADGGTFDIDTDIGINGTQRLTLRFNSNYTADAFIDGSLVDSVGYSYDEPNPNRFAVGGFANGASIYAEIFDFKIFDRELSDDEIASI